MDFYDQFPIIVIIMNNKLLAPIVLVLCLLSGLAIGLVWGKVIARNQQQHQAVQDIKNKSASREIDLLFAMIYIARIHGEITPNKEAVILKIYQEMGSTEQDLLGIKTALTKYKYEILDIHKIIQEYKDISDQKERLFLFKCLGIVALTDTQPTTEVKNFLQTIYNELGLPVS